MIFDFFRIFDIIGLVLIGILFPFYVCMKWGSNDEHSY